MSAAGRVLDRARRLDRRQWRMLAAAAATLVRVNAILKWRSFERAVRFGAVPLGRPVRGADVETIVWAVRASARRVPFRAVCIEQGLAAQRMMRRAGIDALLHCGARPGMGGDDLSAHVWVSVDGRIVIGAEEAVKFSEVATFP